MESTCNPLKNTTKKENPKPHVLLMQIQIGTAIMENSVKAPQKIKNSMSHLYMEYLKKKKKLIIDAENRMVVARK